MLKLSEYLIFINGFASMGFGLCMLAKVSQKISETKMKRALAQLKRKLPGRVWMDLASRESASVDNLRISILPHAVIRVKKGAEVGVVLKLANQYGIPVTARGQVHQRLVQQYPFVKDGSWIFLY